MRVRTCYYFNVLRWRPLCPIETPGRFRDDDLPCTEPGWAIAKPNGAAESTRTDTAGRYCTRTYSLESDKYARAMGLRSSQPALRLDAAWHA